MAYPSIITELSMIGLADAGVPNQERILIRPMEATALNGFGIALGTNLGGPGGPMVLYDNVFWFPAMVVGPPAWIIVFTGRGNQTEHVLPGGEKAYSFYWQRPLTIFNDLRLAPILFRASTVMVGGRLPG